MKRAWWAVLLLVLGCQRAGLVGKLHQDAEVAMREGRLQDAAMTLERALRFDPADQIALERLVLLELRMNDAESAFALATSASGQGVRSLPLRNARIVAAIRLDRLTEALPDARALDAAGGLGKSTEAALIQALVADALKNQPQLWPNQPLSDKWLSAVLERLLETTDVARAAPLFLARSEEDRRSEAGKAFEQRLLERAYREDFTLDSSTLGGLTQPLKTGLQYVARLELALQSRRDDLAERLQPPPGVLQPPYADAWKLGLARLAAQRQDWFGVLQRTQGAPYAETRQEARRQALRCAAYIQLQKPRAARAQLMEWFSEPEAAEAWSATLLLPELRDSTLEMKKMRAGLETARVNGSPRP